MRSTGHSFLNPRSKRSYAWGEQVHLSVSQVYHAIDRAILKVGLRRTSCIWSEAVATNSFWPYTARGAILKVGLRRTNCIWSEAVATNSLWPYTARGAQKIVEIWHIQLFSVSFSGFSFFRFGGPFFCELLGTSDRAAPNPEKSAPRRRTRPCKFF